MMYWIAWLIVTIIPIVGLVFGLGKEWNGLAIVCISILALSFFYFVGLCVTTCSCQEEEAEFVEAKYIIENGRDSEIYDLNRSPNDCNAWLARAQYDRNKYGIWSFYSKQVLELEFIIVNKGEYK